MDPTGITARSKRARCLVYPTHYTVSPEYIRRRVAFNQDPSLWPEISSTHLDKASKWVPWTCKKTLKHIVAPTPAIFGTSHTHRFVDDLDILRIACFILEKRSVIAVDIEFDDINSYHGSTQTIQFTVHDYCFIIDAQILVPHVQNTSNLC